MSEQSTADAILAAVKAGNKTVKEIAARVDASEGTVRKHLKPLLEGKELTKKEGAVKKPPGGKSGRPADAYFIV